MLLLAEDCSEDHADTSNPPSLPFVWMMLCLGIHRYAAKLLTCSEALGNGVPCQLHHMTDQQ